MTRFSKHYPVSVKQMNRIGKFVIEWSNADTATNDLLITLLGINKYDAVPFICRLALGTKLEIFNKLIETRIILKKDSPKKARLLKASKYLLSKNGERNYIIHGYWIPRRTEEAIAIKMRDWDYVTLGVKPFTMTVETLDELIRGTRKATKELWRGRGWLFSLPEPLKRKPAK